MNVQDGRGVGITGVGIYAAIVSGPHAGKAPPPWSVGANGLFLVQGERTHSESIWSVDFDDQYFRGGDRLVYFWLETDAAGGFTSAPPGLNAIPSSIEEAQQATGGLLEVAFLPRIDWVPAYLARIAGHPSGKIDPTPQEIANSRQATSILFVRQRREPRRSGTAHRSLFMRTLDELGYGTLYDEFYINCGGVTYLHHLESRASVAQATGYALIIQFWSDGLRHDPKWRVCERNTGRSDSMVPRLAGVPGGDESGLDDDALDPGDECCGSAKLDANGSQRLHRPGHGGHVGQPKR